MLVSGVFFQQEPMRTAAFLKITTDNASERLQLIQRKNGELIWHCRTDGGQTIKLLLPIEYANSPLLTCLLFDDSLANNAAVIDGIQCQLIDASTFDMANA